MRRLELIGWGPASSILKQINNNINNDQVNVSKLIYNYIINIKHSNNHVIRSWHDKTLNRKHITCFYPTIFTDSVNKSIQHYS